QLAVDARAVVAGPQPLPVGGHGAELAHGLGALVQALDEGVAEGGLGVHGAVPVGAADVGAVQPDLADPALGQLAAGAVVLPRRLVDVGLDDRRPLARGDV